MTLSFWVRSTTTGTWSVSFRNDALDRSYVATYTINVANTWEYKTITVPGDTSGTWLTNNGMGLRLSFALMTGSSVHTAAGAWTAGSFISTSAQPNLFASTANDFYLTGVQLEVGSVATEFERRSYGQELALCQRYYEEGFATARGYASAASAGYNAMLCSFKQSKRVAPSISLSNVTNTGVGTPAALNISIESFVARALWSGAVADANFSADFTASAEL